MFPEVTYSFVIKFCETVLVVSIAEEFQIKIKIFRGKTFLHKMYSEIYVGPRNTWFFGLIFVTHKVFSIHKIFILTVIDFEKVNSNF